MQYTPILSSHHLRTSRLWGLTWDIEPIEDTFLTRQDDQLYWLKYDNTLDIITADQSNIIHQGYKNMAILGRKTDTDIPFFAVSIPDGTNVGGNCRGAGSVDMQFDRDSPEQIASGAFSTIAAGRCNMASGMYSTVRGGRDNSATGTSSTVAGGDYNTASGLGSTVLGGDSNNAVAPYSTVMGGNGNTATVVGSTVMGHRCALESSAIFAIGDPNDDNPSNMFEVHQDGTVYANSYTPEPGADYAEMYESRLDEKIDMGTTVVFQDGYIRPCREDEVPVGVISDTAAVLLNSAHSHWHGKYITVDRTVDVTEIITEPTDITIEQEVYRDGRWILENKITTRNVPVYDQVDIHDESGNVVDKKRIPLMNKVGTKVVMERCINPQFDKSRRYIPRVDRPEWNAVGLLGRCKVQVDQPINPDWILLESGDIYNTYLVR